MAGVNKVIIVGNLGADPEMRQMPSGGAVANITVATSESWNDKNTGDRREVTEWHRIVLFNRLAEVAGQYLRKGSQVYIEGRLRTRKWQDQNGQDRYTTEIHADSMQMLGSRNSNNGGYPEQSSYEPRSSGYGNYKADSSSNAAPTSTRATHSDNSYNQAASISKSTPQPAADIQDFGDDIPF